MKFSDLDNKLEEAPVGLGKRMGAKLQKKLAPGKQRRRRGNAKDEIYTKAKEIKDDWKVWLTGVYDDPNHEANMEDFLQFMQNNTGIGPIANDVAKKLFPKEFKSDEKNKAGGDEVDGDNLELAKDDPKPEEYSDEEKAAMRKKEADAAEAEAKELGSEEADESVEEDTDDAEPKVDMSASIYEAKLQRMLLELKDNEIDTLIFRSIQAAVRTGDGNLDNIRGEYEGPETTKGKSSLDKKEKSKKEPGKYRKTMDKLSSKAFGDAEKINPLSNVGDDEDESDDSSSSSRAAIGGLGENEVDELRDILGSIIKGKSLSGFQKKKAQKLLKQIS